jgi:alpha-tubulin suppressor-like RCC1 family protein
MTCGENHSLVLLSDGSVWAAGNNIYGQLGDGTTIDKSTWNSVISSGVTQVAVGHYHSLALKSDGSVWATGYNPYGQMGDGTRARCNSWKSVISSGVTQVTAGGFHSLALKSDGSVLATGANGNGQLGDGATTDKTTWTSVMPAGGDTIQVLAGFRYSFALKSDGSVWATGNNRSGQLGNGTTTNQSTWAPVSVSSVIQVAVGYSHSLALKSDGTLWKTGTNTFGQLGQEGDGSLVWMPDRFFEKLLLESLLIDPPRSRRKLNESDAALTSVAEPADDWRGLSL